MSVAKKGTRKNVAIFVQKEQRLRAIYEDRVAGFCQSLSPSDSQAVRKIVTEIVGLRQQVIVNMLAIGHCLGKLRSAIGSERFSEFMREVLPSVGISRSTGYRWMSFSEGLALIFSNPLIRDQIMALTDGKGIVAGLKKNRKDNCTRLLLTPAAQEALTVLPPPTTKLKPSESEQWVRQFINATAKARTQGRAPGRNLARDQAAMVKRFRRFAEYYSPQAAEDLCGQLDKVLDIIVKSAKTNGNHRLALT